MSAWNALKELERPGYPAPPSHARFREALGERFDIRRFHDAVLGYGSKPLAVLDKHIDWFIEQEARR